MLRVMTLSVIFLIPFVAIGWTSSAQPNAAKETREVRPHDIETGALALECANYAKYLDDEARYQELIVIGRNKIVGFLNAFTRGDISEQEYRDHVRLDISFKMDAPSADFAAGRIFEYFSGLVDHWVGHERNPDGSVDGNRPREPFERQVEEAQRLYSKNKCHLID